jgi:cyclin-dependent kinase 8/11
MKQSSPAPRTNYKFPPKFEKGEKVGEGTYGLVYLATSKGSAGTRDSKKRYALKHFKEGREGEGISPTAIREIMLLRELQHDNLVHLDSVHINRAESSLWLAFDYAEHDLFEMIRFHR